MSSVLVSALCKDSLLELGVIQPGESLSPDMAAVCVNRLNQLADNWNAERDAVYVETFSTFAFIPNQQDYTIGPSGADFTVPNTRPVEVDAINVLLNNVSPVVSNPVTMRDYQWWTSLTVRSVHSTFPTDCYYAPDWPNGTLHFWPLPTTGYGVEIISRNTLSTVTLNSTINLPVGYHNALMLTLAEDVAPQFATQASATTVKKAAEARARIFSNNRFVPRLTTQDAGMPSNHRNRSAFNYRTGLNMTVNR